MYKRQAFGEIYMSQVKASGVIPQITAVFGTCGGGLALIPTLTDFTFMEGSKAKLFVNAPNALDGNVITKCDTSAADFQSKEAGIVDVVADEAGILAPVSYTHLIHGGLMRLPVLGGVISPRLCLFPHYDGGRFTKAGREMILSRGLGTHTLPIRIFNPGELVVIHLKPKNR